MGDHRRKEIRVHGGRPVDSDQTQAEIFEHLTVLEEKIGTTNPRLRRKYPAKEQPQPPKSLFDMVREDT